MTKSRRAWWIMSVVAILALNVARAQQALTGIYSIKGTKGDIVLTLREENAGEINGTLKGGELSLLLAGQRAEDGNGAVGRATTEAGEFTSFFAVEKQGGRLVLLLVEANAEGEPDYASARPITFPIAAGSVGIVGSGETKPGTAEARPELAGGDSGSGVQATPPGVFAGTFRGDGLTLESRAQGNDYVGQLSLAEEKMPFTGTVVNGVLHGGFEAGGERFDFHARWQGATLVLGSGGMEYKLKKQGGNANPLAKPKTNTNPLSKPKTSAAAPAKIPPAKTAPSPQSKPAGAPTGGAAWQVFKHQTGLSLKYPPSWKAQVVGDALMLVPPDVKQINGGPAEVFLVLSSSAGPVRSGSDPQLEQHVEQQVMQYLPGFMRSGSTQSVKVGNEPGILMNWEGLAQGNPARAQIYATILKQYGVALLAISTKDQIKASRDNQVRQIFTSIVAGAGEKDRQIVGKWFLYSYKSSSGYGNTSNYGRETKSYMTLLPDGTAIWGQQSESTFSSQAGSVGSQNNSGDRGTWSAGKGQLIVVWGDGTTGAWQYRVGGSPGGNRRLFLTQNGKTDEWMEVQ